VPRPGILIFFSIRLDHQLVDGILSLSGGVRQTNDTKGSKTMNSLSEFVARNKNRFLSLDDFEKARDGAMRMMEDKSVKSVEVYVRGFEVNGSETKAIKQFFLVYPDGTMEPTEPSEPMESIFANGRSSSQNLLLLANTKGQ
jgi:hypothetical protein